MIDKRSISNNKLSWKAKGILAYVLSMPDDWVFYVSELEKHSIDGETALRSGLKELEEAGYITKKQTRAKDGKISGYEWIIHELPTISRKTTYGKPTSGKQGTTNINLTNNDNTNLKDFTPQREPRTDPNFDNELVYINAGEEFISPKKKKSLHREMVGILAKVTKMDFNISMNAGRLNRASKQLRDAGYSIKDIERYGVLWKEDWRYKQDKKPPLLSVLLTEIGQMKFPEDSVEDRKKKALIEIERAKK